MPDEGNLPGYVSIFYGSPPETSFVGLGQGVRLAGRRQKVLLIWFLKPPDHYGEEFGLEGLKDALDLFPMYPPLDYGIEPSPEEVQHRVDRGMKLARETLVSREYDLIVLDEILTCCERGLVTWEALTQLLIDRPEYLHLTLCGTICPEEIGAYAHTLVRFDVAKHYLTDHEPRRGFDR